MPLRREIERQRRIQNNCLDFSSARYIPFFLLVRFSLPLQLYQCFTCIYLLLHFRNVYTGFLVALFDVMSILAYA
jgi:hypothetical protein